MRPGPPAVDFMSLEGLVRWQLRNAEKSYRKILKRQYSVFAKVLKTLPDIRSDIAARYTGPVIILPDRMITHLLISKQYLKIKKMTNYNM
jgi:hypothetical protein